MRESTTPEIEELVEGARPVLAFFSGTWCGSCGAMEPVVERLAGRFAGRVEFAKVNTDRNPALAEGHGVISLPTFLLFAGGQVVARAVGACGEHVLAAMLGPYVGGTSGPDANSQAA